MAQAKTRPTQASVAQYIEAIEDDERRADCEAISKIMRKVTKQEPTLWGSSIVGFSRYQYQYASGTHGESCLYIRRLSDVDLKVLEQLITESVTQIKQRYESLQ